MANRTVTKNDDLIGLVVERIDNYYEKLFNIRSSREANCIITPDHTAIYDIHKRVRNGQDTTIVSHKMKLLTCDDEIEIEAGTNGDCYTEEDPEALSTSYSYIRIDGTNNPNIECKSIGKNCIVIKAKGGPMLHNLINATKLISDALLYEEDHIKKGDIEHGDW